ncbi:MAG: peptidyl-prolyl cis-trans isomerase [Oceanococcus sp.]
MKRILRRPAFHFLIIGLCIWCAVQAWDDYEFRQVLSPSTAEIGQLEQNWQQQHGQKLDDEIRAALFQQEIDERILFREALRRKYHLRDTVVLRRLRQDAEFLGLTGEGTQLIQSALDLQLYRGDALIRRRLLERMRSLITRNMPQPSDAELEALYQEHGSEHVNDATYTFQQRFFRNDPSDADSAKRRALQALQQESIDITAVDSFLYGDRFSSAHERMLNQRFGRQFGETLQNLKLEQWQGPIASSYGWHVVKIEQKTAAKPATLLEQTDRLKALWAEQRKQQMLAKFMRRLRPRYRVLP